MKLLLICTQAFNPIEFWTVLGVAKERGVDVDIASTNKVIQNEDTKKRHRIKLTVGDLLDKDLSEYDGLVFTSGDMNMTKKNWHDDRLHVIVDGFHDRDKVIAATCGSVPIIRFAAKGKRVSFFPLVASRQLLEDAGAIPSPVCLTRDDPIVTAEFPAASEMWAEEICNVLEGRPPQYEFTESGFTPKGRERMPIPEVVLIQEGRERARLRKQGTSEEDSQEVHVQEEG